MGVVIGIIVVAAVVMLYRVFRKNQPARPTKEQMSMAVRDLPDLWYEDAEDRTRVIDPAGNRRRLNPSTGTYEWAPNPGEEWRV